MRAVSFALIVCLAGAATPATATAASPATAAASPRTSVVVVPGFLGSDLVYRGLRRGIERRGFAPVKSGIHFNVGRLRTKIDRVKRAAVDAHARTQRPVQLAGHSMGGTIAAVAAHELVAEHPEIFEGLGDLPHVATLGAPLEMAHRKDGSSKIFSWLAPALVPDFASGEASLRELAGPGHRLRLVAGYALKDKIVYPIASTLPWARKHAIQKGGHMRLMFRADDLATMLASSARMVL